MAKTVSSDRMVSKFETGCWVGWFMERVCACFTDNTESRDGECSRFGILPQESRDRRWREIACRSRENLSKCPKISLGPDWLSLISIFTHFCALLFFQRWYLDYQKNVVCHSIFDSPSIGLFITTTAILSLWNTHLRYTDTRILRDQLAYPEDLYHMATALIRSNVARMSLYSDQRRLVVTSIWYYAVTRAIACQEKIGYCQPAEMSLLIQKLFIRYV
jgi:hypothetical protein